LNVRKILRQIIISVEEASLQSSKKALYLKLLEVFCKFEDKLVRPNQQEIIINFVRDVSKNNLIFLFSVEGLPHLIALIDECIPEMFKNQEGTIKKIEFDEGVDQKQMTEQIEMTMEVFNIIMCLQLLALCCDGKSEVAEVKCKNEILNIQNALELYKNAGRFWPFKQAILHYLIECYLNCANIHLFNPDFNSKNVLVLKELVKYLKHDVVRIFEEWHNDNQQNCMLIYPDLTHSSFLKEAKHLAMDGISKFFLAIVKNPRIDLGVDMMPDFHAISVRMAKLYYLTDNKTYKMNAMEYLSFINSSDKYSFLLDNVQHPANQNIYIEAKKVVEERMNE
jgi:hypothetical protein